MINVRRFLPACFISLLLVCACSVAFTGNAQADTNQPVVVSMGDSYSSGEGLGDYYGDKTSGEEVIFKDWLAHRSTNSWPGQLKVPGSSDTALSAMKDKGWYFTAASGATTEHIEGSFEKKFSNSECHFTSPQKLDPQINIFKDKDLNGKVDYVTITLGGNDLGFAELLFQCAITSERFGLFLAPTIDYKLRTFDKKISHDLAKVYSRIQEEAGGQAKIIVAGYPCLMNEEALTKLLPVDAINTGALGLRGPLGDLPLLFSAIEAHHLNRGVKEVDKKYRNLVKELSEDGNQYGKTIPGITYVSVVDAFHGKEAYSFLDSQKSAINPLILITDSDQLDKGILDTVWLNSSSFHPNAMGAEIYRAEVQKEIDRLEGEKTANGNAQSAEASNGEATETAVADTGVSFSMILDISTSMDSPSAYSSTSKLEAAKKQASAFVESLQNQANSGGATVDVAVGHFSSNAGTDLPLSTDYVSVQGAVSNLFATGNTDICAGLREGIASLESATGSKVMVFLSDGNDVAGNSHSDIMAVAQEAADKNIKIYTIGFGDPSSIDEPLLQDVADATGAEYSHEDPSSLKSATVGVFGAMTKATVSATQTVLKDEQGAVAQGQTTEPVHFNVDQSGDLSTVLYWPGSKLDLKLIDPDGTEVTEGYQGYTVISDATPAQIKIANAKQGEWSMSVYGEETSMAEEPYYLISSLQKKEYQAAVGGASNDSGGGLLIVLFVLLAGSVLGVLAITKREQRQ